MVSVLIPIHNFSVVALVNDIHKQFQGCDVSFEIIGLDDCSKTEFIEENRAINLLSHTKLIENKANLGRTASRQKLAELANYNWLLFLDSDVLPTTNAFISNYIPYLNKSSQAIFGGFSYNDTYLSPKESLRIKYGKNREDVPAVIRNKTPYKIIISANFLIKKPLFLKLNNRDHSNSYGLDNLFGASLKQQQTPITHIDNPVYHLGLDSNDIYLKKIRESLKTMARLLKSDAFTAHDNSFIKAYNLLNTFHLTGVFSAITKMFEPALKKQLTGKNPNLILLDIYKLGYFCRLK